MARWHEEMERVHNRADVIIGKRRHDPVGTVDQAFGGCRLVVTHSPKRARKDARERERRIERLRAALESSGAPAALSSRGAARFLDFPDGQLRLNEAKVAEAARWDGLWGVMAWGCDQDDPRDLVIQYRRAPPISCTR